MARPRTGSGRVGIPKLFDRQALPKERHFDDGLEIRLPAGGKSLGLHLKVIGNNQGFSRWDRSYGFIADNQSTVDRNSTLANPG